MKRVMLIIFVGFVKLNLFGQHRPVYVVPRTFIVVKIF
jgi:hypothetical protein